MNVKPNYNLKLNNANLNLLKCDSGFTLTTLYPNIALTRRARTLVDGAFSSPHKQTTITHVHCD